MTVNIKILIFCVVNDIISIMEKTIATISTPLGKGAIAIVRMSGEKAKSIALDIFSAKNLTTENISARYMYFGKLNLGDGAFEECLMVYFKAPFSYTGEDLIEFQVHGGVLLAQKVLEKCLSAGASLAEPGEFSKRAFLNGKITLDKAEAIVGEINAESEGELKNSLKITNGTLAEKILEEQDKLKYMLAELEVGMDYPDEIEELNLKLNIKGRLKKIADENEILLKNSQYSTYLKNGINVALVGKTNVGKSSIMNALLGQDRAIVTDIQGTTRDSICESFLYKGVKINVIDTAGIRKTNDLVESIGIEKSLKSIETADLVLFVLDGSERLDDEDKELLRLVENKKHLIVINKADKVRKIDKFENEISISALKNENIEKLKDKIFNMVISEEFDMNSLAITNERQTQILKDAQKQIEDILTNNTLSLDILTMLVKDIWKTLGKITGNTENEDIIDLIFSKFCLGK